MLSKVKDLLKRKNVTLSPKLYFIDAMGKMALGLFASLLIGTIFKTLGEQLPKWIDAEFVKSIGKGLTDIAGFASGASGMAIGVAVAYALKAPPLVLFTAAVVGNIGYNLETVFESAGKLTAGPAGAFIAVLIACEIGKLVAGSTKVDILVTPAVTILTGFAVSKLFCPAIAWSMYYLGQYINTATEYQPLIMGIVIGIVVGVILTLPISSAAICAMIGISGIAGGAAVVGCCAQMIGFAVISYRENKVSGLVAQGLGTSMLQMGNITRKPIIWVPPTIASGVCGALATTVFKLQCKGVAAGMGTCGLVGPLGIISETNSSALMWTGLILLCFVVPAVVSLIFSELFRKFGLIKFGDMKLDLN